MKEAMTAGALWAHVRRDWIHPLMGTSIIPGRAYEVDLWIIRVVV